MPKLVLEITGQIGAGKTSASRYLAGRYGLGHHCLSDYFTGIMGHLPIPMSRELYNLITIGHRALRGESALAEHIFHKIDSDPHPVVITEGTRWIELDRCLRRRYQNRLVLIYIDTFDTVRFNRLAARASYKDRDLTYERFRRQEQMNCEREVPRLRLRADYVVHNNHLYRDLFAQLNALVKQLQHDTRT